MTEIQYLYMALIVVTSGPDAKIVGGSEEVSDLGLVGDDAQGIGGGSFSPAPGEATD